MSDQLVFDPPFPASQIIALGIVLAVLTLVSYIRSQGGAGKIKRGFLTLFRLAVITGLTVILLRPMVLESEPVQSAKSSFSVLIDTSGSMETQDMEEGSRLEAVKQGLDKYGSSVFDELSLNYDLRFYSFAENPNATTLNQVTQLDGADGESTDLATALLRMGGTSATKKQAGVLLISDGRNNAGGDVNSAAKLLRSQNIPVWTTPVGTDAETKDLYITARLDQSFLYVKQGGSLRIDLSQAGYDGWYAGVEVFREGKSLGTQQVRFSGGNEQIKFPIQEDTKGTFSYTVKVEPLKGEADNSNNERTVYVRAIDEQSKVLLVEAEPYWDSKFLLRALQADPNLDITSIFFMNPDKVFSIVQKPNSAGEGEEVPPVRARLPQTKSEFFKYDVIILGRGIDYVFTADQMRLLKAYLEERGGSVVFARGKSYTSLRSEIAELEPVIWDSGVIENAKLELTSAGKVSPIFQFGQSLSTPVIIRELPEMVSVTRVKEEKSLSVVLAKSTGAGSPEEIAAIAYQRYGKGKVLSIGSAGLWRWAFMPEELSRYDEVYARFWGQMLRWLIYGSDFLPGQNIAFRTDRNAYSLGESVAMVVQTKFVDTDTFHPRVQLKQPNGKAVTVELSADTEEPSYFSSLFRPEQEGVYKAELLDQGASEAKQSLEFTVYSNSVEKRFVASDEDLMDKIARTTTASVLPMSEWGQLPSLVRDFELSLKEEAKPHDVWDRLSIFSILCVLLAIEWFVRRKTGMV